MQIKINIIIGYFVDDHDNESVYWFKDMADLEEAEKEMQELWGGECIKTETITLILPVHWPRH